MDVEDVEETNRLSNISLSDTQSEEVADSEATALFSPADAGDGLPGHSSTGDRRRRGGDGPGTGPAG